MKPTKSQTAAQFTATADAYVTSPGHAAGRDLERVVELVAPEPTTVVLDVATGGGHTAVAVARHARAVVASDLTAAMTERAQHLARGQGLTNVIGMVADAERLPFAAAAFDAVTCRIAPHHFADLETAVEQIARVLRPGGVFVVEDSTVPEEPVGATFLNGVEALRDPTHVRSRSPREWRDLLAAAGMVTDVSELHRKRHVLDQWFDRANTPATARGKVIDAFVTAPAGIQHHFEVEFDADGRPLAYSDDKVILRSVKPM